MGVGDVVDQVGEGDFVVVEREGLQGEIVCEVLDIRAEDGGAREGEWIVHRGGGGRVDWYVVAAEVYGRWSLRPRSERAMDGSVAGHRVLFQSFSAAAAAPSCRHGCSKVAWASDKGCACGEGDEFRKQ